MPAADSTTSPEASSKKVGKALIPTSWENDIWSRLLQLVTDKLVDTELATEAATDTKSFEARLNRYMAETKPVPPDICNPPIDDDVPRCGNQSLAYQQATLTFDNASETAAATLRTALGTWNAAIRAYQFAIAQADGQLHQAELAAAKVYDTFISLVKDKNFEASGRYYQFYTKKLAIAEAIQAHTASAAAAADALAGAAGVLIGAAQTYKDQIKTAQAQRDIDEATADQTFWQNYESSPA